MSEKQEITITFKVDSRLAHELDAIPNKSAFIRDAVSRALFESCPLCLGRGVLPREQQRHWSDFLRHHHLEDCPVCHCRYPVCEYDHSNPLPVRHCCRTHHHAG